MAPRDFGVLLEQLPEMPDGIAVMGKWEPFLPAEDCLEEVAARSAAALALSEALAPHGIRPYLLSAEAQLRGQPRPGCLLAADILLVLGASADRIRLCAAANRTSVEVHTLERMRAELGLSSLLCITAGYHADRARWLIRREGLDPTRLQVLSCQDDLVQAALSELPAPRRARLWEAIEGRRRDASLLTISGLNERVARLGARFPFVEKLLADLVRGRVEAPSPIFSPGV